MSSLFGTLGIARQALVAQQYGPDVTQNNVANMQALLTREELKAL
jgi:flagellar hook-associated protein FlgK